MSTHQEHVFGKPAFSGGLLNGQPQRELFQPYGVAAVLGVDAVDDFFFEIDIDSAFFDLLTYGVFQLPLGVEVPEEIGRRAELF